jgi:hypothetical protein
VPEPNSDFVAIAGGSYFSLGLKSNGSIVAWGNNDEGQCDVPSPNSGFVAVAAGEFFSLGLESDGSIVGWGSNSHGKCDAPEPNERNIAISAGYGLSVAIRGEPDPALIPGLDPSHALRIVAITPNPFGPRTTIAFELPRAGDGTLRVYDVGGRLVRTLWQGTLPAGAHRVTWEGLDAGARAVPAGIYLMRLEAGSGAARVAKVILTR